MVSFKIRRSKIVEFALTPGRVTRVLTGLALVARRCPPSGLWLLLALIFCLIVRVHLDKISGVSDMIDLYSIN